MTIEDYLVPPIAGLDLKESFSLIKTVDESELSRRLSELDYNAFLDTTYWRSVAFEVKHRDGNHCRVCNHQKNLCAHHRRYMDRGTEHLHMADLTTLCDPCHRIFHENGRVGNSKLLKPKKETAQRVKRGKLTKAERREQKRLHQCERLEAIRLRKLPTNPGRQAGHGEIQLTRELIDALKTNGAFTSATTRALGLTDFTKGWTSRLRGVIVTREQYQGALGGRHVTLRSKKEIRDGNFLIIGGKPIYNLKAL